MGKTGRGDEGEKGDGTRGGRNLLFDFPKSKKVNSVLTTRVTQSSASDAGASVEIVHESLIRSWPRLRRWLEENQDDAAFLDQLRSAAKQWYARGCAPGLLWRGAAVEEARVWARRYRGELPARQRGYLDAVFDLAARSMRRKRYALASVIAFLSLMVAAAAVALFMISDAQMRATAEADEAERQLNNARVAQARANTERQNALRAAAELERTNDELGQKNAALVTAIDTVQQARRRAETLQKRAEKSEWGARRSKRQAKDKEREAREAANVASAAAADARRANNTLETLLARERKRVRQLEEQTRGATVVSDVVLD